MTDLDCDGAGVYVVPNVFNPRDLVSRPDNMDETVPHILTQITEKIPSQDMLCNK